MKIHQALKAGIAAHEPAQQTFVEVHGYYNYERHVCTDAFAALAFGCGMPLSIETTFFSYNEAKGWILFATGINVDNYLITNPMTGIRESITEVMTSLYHEYRMSREFIHELFRQANL